MKLVIDSNRLQSDELRVYLAKSQANLAVLTDFAAMEAYKGDTLASIFKSMGVLSDFPDQVLVLKGGALISRMRGRRKGLQSRLVDDAQSRGFPAYIHGLRLAQIGRADVRRQLLSYGKDATDHLDALLTDAEATGAALMVMAKEYTKQERQAVRLGEEYPLVSWTRLLSLFYQWLSRF